METLNKTSERDYGMDGNDQYAQSTDPFQNNRIEINNHFVVLTTSKPGKRPRIQKPLYSVRL